MRHSCGHHRRNEVFNVTTKIPAAKEHAAIGGGSVIIDIGLGPSGKATIKADIHEIVTDIESQIGVNTAIGFAKTGRICPEKRDLFHITAKLMQMPYQHGTSKAVTDDCKRRVRFHQSDHICRGNIPEPGHHQQ